MRDEAEGFRCSVPSTRKAVIVMLTPYGVPYGVNEITCPRHVWLKFMGAHCVPEARYYGVSSIM